MHATGKNRQFTEKSKAMGQLRLHWFIGMLDTAASYTFCIQGSKL